jgi:hypothetical protein
MCRINIILVIHSSFLPHSDLSFYHDLPSYLPSSWHDLGTRGMILLCL